MFSISTSPNTPRHMFPRPQLSSLSLILLSLLLLLLFNCNAALAVSTTLRAGELLCLQEVVPAQSSITFQFQVLHGGQRDIQVIITNQNHKILKEWQDASEGIYEVHAAAANTQLINVCLDNRPSHYTSKTIVFHFRYHVDYNAVARKVELDPVEKQVEKIAAEMKSVEELQLYLKSQQREHRATVEEANERLYLWSIFQVLALVGMSGFQLYVLKRFLERKSFV